MQIPRPTDIDRERFHSLVPDDPRVEVKPMFGNLGAFVNGNMFMGLFGSAIGVKLPPADAAELRMQPGAGPFGPSERPMGGYVSLPASMVEAGEGDRWVARALEFVGGEPAKRKK